MFLHIGAYQVLIMQCAFPNILRRRAFFFDEGFNLRVEDESCYVTILDKKVRIMRVGKLRIS